MSLRNKIAHLAAAATLTLSQSALADPDVKAFTQVSTTRNAVGNLVQKRVFCNFSLVNIGGEIKYLTARHCITRDDTIPTDGSDIILLDELPNGAKTGDMRDARVHSPSEWSAITLGNHTLTIKGYLPNMSNNTMIPYTITGTTKYDPSTKMNIMTLTREDLHKMLTQADRSCKTQDAYLGGMSGGVALDEKGSAFGVLSVGEALCIGLLRYSIHNLKTVYTMGITPLKQ